MLLWNFEDPMNETVAGYAGGAQWRAGSYSIAQFVASLVMSLWCSLVADQMSCSGSWTQSDVIFPCILLSVHCIEELFISK
jgi:hypothetical protein